MSKHRIVKHLLNNRHNNRALQMLYLPVLSLPNQHSLSTVGSSFQTLRTFLFPANDSWIISTMTAINNGVPFLFCFPLFFPTRNRWKLEMYITIHMNCCHFKNIINDNFRKLIQIHTNNMSNWFSAFSCSPNIRHFNAHSSAYLWSHTLFNLAWVE